MDVQVEKTGSYNRKISITVPAGEVDKAWEAAYRKIAKGARIPGFRPGKAPKSVIDLHYSAEMKDEVENQLISETLSKAIVEHAVEAVSRPKVETGDLKRGSAYSFSAELEVRPEIEVKKYKGLVVPPVSNEVPEADINAQLEEMRTQAAQLVPVMVRDTVQQGDLVLCDFEGFIGGVPFRGGKADGAMVEIGGEGYIPGFAEALEGAKVPSERTIAVTFPTDYSVADLRGKDATFAVKLKEIKTKELPRLDDDFAKDVGEESLAALKTKIRGRLEERRKKDAKAEEREALLKALNAANPFDVPPSMIAEQADRMIIDAATRVQQIMGNQFDLSQLDVEALRRENRERAEFVVRGGLLLVEVAKVAKVEVDERDLETEIERMATEAADEGERVRAHFRAPDERQKLRYKLLEDKTIDLLLSEAVRKES